MIWLVHGKNGIISTKLIEILYSTVKKTSHDLYSSIWSCTSNINLHTSSFGKDARFEMLPKIFPSQSAP
jgi:hypothetical protein